MTRWPSRALLLGVLWRVPRPGPVSRLPPPVGVVGSGRRVPVGRGSHVPTGASPTGPGRARAAGRPSRPGRGRVAVGVAAGGAARVLPVSRRGWVAAAIVRRIGTCRREEIIIAKEKSVSNGACTQQQQSDFITVIFLTLDWNKLMLGFFAQ